MTDINKILNDRQVNYGDFAERAKISQDIKQIMQNCPNWEILEADQKESLEMVIHKISRILNGNPNYDDNWIDISGYITLVVKRLQKDQNR
jgi:hypothetical protein